MNPPDSHLNGVSAEIIEETRAKARLSPRKRAHYLLHQPEEFLQRIVQVVQKGSYYAPHRHPKLEFFVLLEGEAAAVLLDDDGRVKDVAMMSTGNIIMAEVPLDAWHTFIVLSEEAVFLEVIAGYYDATTHHGHAPWTIPEDDPRAVDYLASLTKEVLAYAQKHQKGNHGNSDNH